MARDNRQSRGDCDSRRSTATVRARLERVRPHGVASVTEWPGDGPSGGGRCANLIWPRDRSWCIAAEIDWDSTLVACSTEIVDQLLADTRLETFEVGYHDDLSWYGDLLNPHPAWLPLRDRI